MGGNNSKKLQNNARYDQIYRDQGSQLPRPAVGERTSRTAEAGLPALKSGVNQIRRNNRQLQMNRKGFKPSIRTKRYKYSYGDIVVKQSSIQQTGWEDKLIKKDKIVYSSKGVFNYGKWIRLENPIQGEKDLNLNIKDVILLKYGSGLLFQLPKVQNEKRKKIEKTIEKKNHDMFKQGNIINAWN